MNIMKVSRNFSNLFLIFAIIIFRKSFFSGLFFDPMPSSLTIYGHRRVIYAAAILAELCVRQDSLTKTWILEVDIRIQTSR